LAVAVVFAFTRSRPDGILKALPVDLLWGLGLGMGLRLLQGVSEGANSAAFPVVANLSGGLPPEWFFANVLPAAVVGPLVEEFFFRAVVLISVFQYLYRPVGAIAAALTGLLVSVGSFVLLHSLFGPLSLQAAVQLAIVGTTCGALVLLTGRIWAAVIAHSVYNISYLVLLAVGTMLS
jgi:membrane protease YdiL (CAAX protease family)